MRRIKSYYTADETINGLYTLGGEYMTTDNTEYIGPYHRYTTTGEIFTEPTWNIRQSQKLVVFQNLPASLKTYRSIKTVPVARIAPSYAPVTIQNSDIATGYITRYFYKKRNEDAVFETDDTQYQQWLSGQQDRNLWDIVPCQWKITGPIQDTTQNGVTLPGVTTANQRAIAALQPVLPTITQYVTNFTEYYTDSDFITPKDINGLDS
jgi:hypothetical protein